MKRVLVCGAGGFIGAHLTRRLADEGSWVRAIVHTPRPFEGFEPDEQLVADLRDPDACAKAVLGGFDEIYQLSADMGGMEFISAAEAEIMRNNALINTHMVDAAAREGVGRYFFSSSVCVYRDMEPDEPELTEDDAYPAMPDNEYGWEKIYAERMLAAQARTSGFEARIGRFENCYGPGSAWRGGREKAPAALSRKVAEASDGDAIEVFGGGSTIRTFIYVDDLVDAVVMLMRSHESRPTNIGNDEYVTIRELVETTAKVAGKDLSIKAVDGPLGVQSRHFSHERIRQLGFEPAFTLAHGMARTYPWVAQQVENSR